MLTDFSQGYPFSQICKGPIDDVYGWSLTYVATPIAVAVREALFTSGGLCNLTGRDVQSSLQCTAPFVLIAKFLTLSTQLVSVLNALAKACPFDLGSLCGGVVLFGPVSPGS